MSNFQGWIAYLSTGETIPETPNIAGDYSSWQKLLKRCRDDNIEIKRMSLVMRDVQLMSLPHKQCDGYFQAYEIRKNLFESTGNPTIEEIRSQGIGSIVGEQVFIQWINITPKEHVIACITSEIRTLKSCIIHTTLS